LVALRVSSGDEPAPIWQSRLNESQRRAPICWLAGVRRVGKATLSRAVPDAAYFNCDLPEVAAVTGEPVRFWRGVERPAVILDEVHQLPDPSRVLKIAADEFPHLRVLATGSSTLSATEKFRDALTGRKRVVHLVPVLPEELGAFGVDHLERRLLRGGLPPPLLADDHDRGFYAGWLDAFFARDVRELFRVEKRGAFLALFEALLRQSGGIFEATSLARAAGLSRPTVLTDLNAIEVKHAVTVLRPWSGGRSDRDLVQAPKAYGFDTGFVCYARRIRELRPEDRGLLLEHLALESLQAVPGLPRVHYWRDSSGHEVDFVVLGDGACDAYEVEWSADAFEPRGLRAFRSLYPAGRNIVVTAQTAPPYVRILGGLEVECVSIEALRGLVTSRQ
jgi:predicted AAA+ superfamily ATPase